MSDTDPQPLRITADEYREIMALGQTFAALGDLFVSGEGTVAALRMAAASCRRAADVLDDVADRWGA